ncbi:MAG: SDR family NAD(P)-dependent oxidoreductase [Dermatophilaceae bacterium]
MTERPDLTGKVAMVTGGAGGIGRAATTILVEHGAQVALCDIDEAATAAAAAELGAHPFLLDVSDYDANTRTVAQIEDRLGGLDIAFLNAGIGLHRGLAEFDLALYRRIMGVNVDGVAFGTQAAAPAMRRRGGGHIVVTASLGGLVAMTGDPYYALTKAGVIGYVRAAALELAKDDIVVQALCPGFADTGIIDQLRDSFARVDFPIIDTRVIAQTLLRAVTSDEAGVVWLIQAGWEPEPYSFRGVPAARRPDGTPFRVPRSDPSS